MSYSRRDEDYVTRLAGLLEAAGLPVWLDRQCLEVGDRWEHELRDRVDDCAAMVVVMSPAAEASPHVGNELQRARDRGKPILPVLLSGPRWFALGTTNYFDALRGELPDQRFVERLRRHTAGHPGAAAATRAPVLLAGDLPGRAVAWQERPGLLDALVAAAGPGGTTVVAALAGQRGVGKTQLAAAYARLRMQHGWPVIVWADASSEQGIVTALDELATLAGLHGPDDDPRDAARRAVRWLRSHPGPCLLVYDNAEDADLVRSWTPAVGAVQTVVTSTVRALDTLGDLIDVTLFTPAEAVAYLDRRTRLGDPGGAAGLAEQLGWLPLALAQAGAVIGRGKTYPTYGRYVVAMARTPTDRLLAHPAGDPYPLGLAEAVLLALDDLGRAPRGAAARRLLDRLAVLAPTGADPALLGFLTADDEADDDDADNDADATVAILAGRSLTVGADGDRVVIHRLIQRVVREQNARAGTAEAAVAAATAALGAATSRTASQWQRRAALADYTLHAESVLTHAHGAGAEAVVRLLGSQLYLLNDTHSYSTSVTAGPAVVAAHERVLGADHPETLRSRGNLAYAYRAVGRIEEAIALNAEVLAGYERVLGPDHPDTLRSQNNLAGTYQAIGRIDEALALNTRNLADYERTLGADHPETLLSRHNLANAYQAAGRAKEALALNTRALADYERVLGADHPDTLLSRNNLAYTYRTVGRMDEAIALYARNLADYERIRGADHPDTLLARNNLAYVYRTVGRIEEAIALNTEVLAGYERVLGPDHPDTLLSRNNLAIAYQVVGRTDEATAMLARTLADRERILGPDHPDTLVSRSNLAYAYGRAGRIDEATDLYARTLADRERILGPDHPETLRSRDNLAAIHRAAGRPH